MPSLQLANQVTLTFDEPNLNEDKPTKVVLFALPNGNTTAQSFGKKLASGDDWHFDIQAHKLVLLEIQTRNITTLWCM